LNPLVPLSTERQDQENLSKGDARKMNEDTKKVTAVAAIMIAVLVIIMSFRYLGSSNPPAETTHNVADSKQVVDTIKISLSFFCYV